MTLRCLGLKRLDSFGFHPLGNHVHVKKSPFTLLEKRTTQRHRKDQENGRLQTLRERPNHPSYSNHPRWNARHVNEAILDPSAPCELPPANTMLSRDEPSPLSPDQIAESWTNSVCCFKPLHFSMVSYTAIDNWKTLEASIIEIGLTGHWLTKVALYTRNEFRSRKNSESETKILGRVPAQPLFVWIAPNGYHN